MIALGESITALGVGAGLELRAGVIVAQWFGPDRMDELIEAKTGQGLTARVAAPHAGWP